MCPRKFTLRVDNQALSWLKTYSTDQALIDRWIMALEKYNFRVEHRPRTQHRNADGLSKRTNGCRWRERQLEKLPPVAERWNFLSQDEYERLPTAPWFDQQGRVIPNHPEIPIHLKNLQPNPPDLVHRVIRRSKRSKRRAKRNEALHSPLPSPPPPILHAHEDFYPDYPEDWIDVTEEARHDYLLPTHATNIASRTTYDVANTEGAALQNAPTHIKQAVMAIRSVNTELHEHTHTVHGIKDLVLAQNRDVHVLAI